MREILFRGKRLDDYANDKSIDYTEKGVGEWVYGDIIHRRYYKNKDVIVIRTEDSGFDNYSDYEVDPDSIGQFTGLTDKNGKKIFEGDILKFTDTNAEYEWIGKVEFGNPNAEYNWGFQLVYISGTKPNTDILLWFDMEETGAYSEVIGNIHDNPELLENP